VDGNLAACTGTDVEPSLLHGFLFLSLLRDE